MQKEYENILKRERDRKYTSVIKQVAAEIWARQTGKPQPEEILNNQDDYL